MSETSASIKHIKAQAAEAFANDQPVCACPYPYDPVAAAIWKAEYTALSNPVRGRVAA